ncbi:MAG: asparagine synthase (glutamine-hydrolyzing) [Vicingaceae bacterium]
MCGICGYLKRGDLVDKTLIAKMTVELSHRGPDASGFYSDERIELGHRRLKVLDISDDGNQPFYSRDGRYVMVYNGEIYNYQELAKEMDYKALTGCDTEILLEAFVKWGDAFVDKLNGMFAMVIYDRQSGKIHAWRDRFGIKPFYYYWDGLNFAFASELKALFCLPLEKQLDTQSIGDYLFLEYIPSPGSPYAYFHKLGHGSKLVLNDRNLEINRYYDITDKLRVSEEISEKAALVQFTELFHSSVALRNRADVPLGAFFSGGTDSSAVLQAMYLLENDCASFHIGFDDAEVNETNFAIEIASMCGSDLNVIQMKPDELLADLDPVNRGFDSPFAVSSIYPTSKISEIARKEITVALSGDGGDELFMGYGHYRWYRRLKKLDKILGSSARSMLSSALVKAPDRFARISEMIDYGDLKRDWPHIWSQEQYMFSEREINRLMGGQYENQTLRSSWRSICQKTDDEYLRISLFDLENYLPDDLLYKVDMASMAHGLEVRLPFLDHRLVEFAVNLPTELKFKGDMHKIILKKYLEQVLPKSFIYRPKWGFGAPIRNWMKVELKEYVQSRLETDVLNKSNVFDPKEVKELLDQFYSGKSYLNKRIWALVQFVEWHQRYS